MFSAYLNQHKFASDLPKYVNYIILACKFYIYRQRLYHDSKFELPAFLGEFRNKLKIEKYICSREA